MAAIFFSGSSWPAGASGVEILRWVDTLAASLGLLALFVSAFGKGPVRILTMIASFGLLSVVFLTGMLE